MGCSPHEHHSPCDISSCEDVGGRGLQILVDSDVTSFRLLHLGGVSVQFLGMSWPPDREDDCLIGDSMLLILVSIRDLW
jgi:hypothetical protein